MVKRKRTRPSRPDYPLLVRPLSHQDGGGYLAEVPDLPGCVSDGETPAEAIGNARDAIRAWIDAMKAHRNPIPPPTIIEDYSGKWVQRVPKSLHRALAERARIEGVSLNTLVTTILSGGIAKKDRAA